MDRDLRSRKTPRADIGSTVTAVLDTRPQFESVEGAEATVLVDGTRRRLNSRQSSAGPAILHQRGKKSEGNSPIQFHDGYLNHPGLFSVELGFSTASINYEGHPSADVVVPHRYRNNYELTDAEDAQLITMMEREFPEYQGKLTKSISASYDSETFLSQNCSSIFNEALRPSIDIHSVCEPLDSISLSSSMNSMFHVVSQDHTRACNSSIGDDSLLRDHRGPAARSTTILYNGTRQKSQQSATASRQHKSAKILQ
ncbi:hypothetical protein GL50803_006451 [Giardia duodenalis]|uniref:Uncharacterized protein n=2 Tax=Giardia intestinalis TaxID=5741 RepID=D3KG57_GIAIC|nr:hypothetical protein GL50803_006451 [Giardia intestinalis]ESU37261.1 Hypothetical protein DHA2_6451 [Giardia intestinalis]KAE8303611.1 hypothetical protein GL50803_006451 [Giardia intestinalis]